MSLFNGLGLTLEIHNPLWAAFNPTVPLGDYTNLVAGWSHRLAVDRGYDNASCVLTADQNTIEDWLMNGLGRWVVGYGPDHMVFFEGFVDEINARYGGLNVRRGPLLSVANRTRVLYTIKDTTIAPAAFGARTGTAWVDNLASQARYGIISKVVSGGSATPVEAAQLAQVVLADYNEPETNKTLASSASGTGNSVTLSIKGIVYWMQTYPYVNLGLATTNPTTKIQAILAASPNPVYSTDYSLLAANATIIPQYENEEKPALGIVSGLVALGDAAFNRWTFGIYNNRRAEYQPAPQTAAYSYSLSSPDAVIRNYRDESEVSRWSVRPGRWLFFPDFMVGKIPPTAPRADPRMLFIEDVTFTAPDGLQVNGSKMQHISQLLAQLGMYGKGATTADPDSGSGVVGRPRAGIGVGGDVPV